MAIAPNNRGGNKFYYDRRAESEFSVPKGWVFIVTDVIVYASPTRGPIPDPARFVLAVVSFTDGSDRVLQVTVSGDEIRHFALSGAYVIPSGHSPEFRNTTSSNTNAEANLLGYFVPGDGLEPGEPAFP